MVPAPGEYEIPKNYVCRFALILLAEKNKSFKITVYRYYTMSAMETIELVLTDNQQLSVYYDDAYLRGRSYYAEEMDTSDKRVSKAELQLKESV